MTRAVLRKELAVLFASPLPYVVGALFNAVTGLLYVDQLKGREQALLQPLFPLAAFLLLLAVPVLAMRSFAEERRTGSLDLLLAIPVRNRSLVIGKWLAAWLTSLVVTLPTAVFVVLVYQWGDPDPGPMWSGYIGLLLLTAAVAGVGVLASSLTSSQPVAAMLALFTVLLLWFSDVGPNSVTFGGVLAHFSLSERLRSFSGGAVDSGDVVFLVVMASVCLVAAGVAVRRTRRQVMAAVVVLLVLAAADIAADRQRRIVDLTAEDSLNLARQTKTVLKQVKKATTINVYLPADDPDRAAAGPLLLRYERLNRRISTHIKEPTDAPGELRRFGLDAALGGVAVQQGDQFEVAETVTEQDITGAIVQLQRGRERHLCASAGHGEAGFGDDGTDGLSEAGRILLSNGYTVQPVDLLAAGAAVPPACDALVVVNPLSDLGPGAAAIAQYLANDGRALFLTDPLSTVDLNGVLSPYALSVRRGIVFEGEDQSSLPDDPTTPVVRRFASGHPAVHRVPPSYFPGVQAVEVGRSREAEGLITSRLADTSDQSFLEMDPLEPKFDEGKDVRGPITIAAAAEKMRAETDAAHRTRIVVVGDFDFASNAAVAQAGNSALLLRMVDWLTAQDDELLLSTNLPAYRPLSLSTGQLAYARLMAAGVVPLLFLLAGAIVWALRRSR